MYTLHIANKNYSSWSLRPWVLMRALGIDFAEEVHPFLGASGESRAAFRAFSPTGKVPALVDGDVTVWDSLAIAEYLAEQHPQVWPKDRVARAWARSASAEMHSSFQAVRNQCGMSVGLRIRLNERTPALEDDITRISALWAEGLRRFGGPFLAGPAFTAVDAFYCPVAFRHLTYGLFSGEAAAYAERLLALPAMQDWYAAGIAETWRETGHEDEIRAAGDWLEDLRAT